MHAQLVPTNWSGNADWTTPANWSNGIGSITNIATVANGTANVGDTRSVGALTLSGGTLGGTGSLTLVSTGSSWQSGTLSGTGSLNIGSGADFTISTGNSKTLNNVALTNAGTITWTGGFISSGNGATLANQSGATFSTNFDGTLANNLGGNRTTFNNSGTFAKTAGTGISDIQAAFNNTNTVNVASGTLQLSGGGNSTGTVNLSASSTKLRLTSTNYEFGSGSTLNGPGSIEVAGATTNFTGDIGGTANLVVSGGTATISGNTTTSGGGTFSGGILNGPGTFTLGSTATLNGTTLTGAGTINANGGVAITNHFSFNGTRSLNLGGNSTWSAGYLYGGGGSILTVGPTANFTTSFDGTLNGTYYGGGASTTVVNNQGNFTKSSGAANAATNVSAVFNNTGTINVQAGTLELEAGGTHSGTVNVSSGATLALAGGNHTFNSGALINGAGNLKVSGGNTTFSGANTGSANIVVSGGNTAFNGTTSTSGGGIFSGGTLSGTGTLSLGSTVTLSGTTLTGAGTLNANAGADITGHFSFNGTRSLNLAGNSTWSAGYLYGGGGSILTNKPGATFTTTTNSALNGTYYGGGTATTVFNNQGTFVKAASTGITEISAIVQNSGTINVQTGTLELRGGGTNTGLLELATGAILDLGGATYSLDSGTSLAGPGTLRISGGTTTLTTTVASAGAGDFSGGNFNGSGQITFSGPITLRGTTLSGTGVLAASGGASITNSFSINSTQTLSLGGNSTWSAGTIYHGTGATLNNTGNLTNSANTSLHHYYGGTKLAFNNSGTFTKSASEGTTDIDATFNNTGTVSVQSGKLEIRGGGSNTGTIDLAPGATFAINGGTFGFGASSQITGAGTILVAGGNATFAGAATTTANLSISHGNATLSGNTSTSGGGAFSGGTLNGTGNLTLAAPVAISGTTLAGSGNLHAAGGATLANSFTLKDGQNLTLAGTSTWSAGTIYHGNGGALHNTGNLTNTSNASLYHYYGGAKLTFNNSGTFTKSTATGSTYLNALFNNTGTVNVQAGTLELEAGGSSSGPINVSSGATLLVSAGNFDVANATQLAGAGLLRLIGGTLNLAGALGIDTLTLEGGRLTGTHTFDRTVNWHYGDLNATAAASSTTVASGATLVLANGGYKDFNARTLVNAAGGSVYWHTGYLRSGNGGSFVNHGTFYDKNVSGYSIHNPGTGSGFGGAFSFNNHGTYVRDVANTTYIQVPFNNHGTVNLNLGDIQLSGGGTMSASSLVNAATGTHLYFTASYTLADGAQLAGSGNFIQTGGTLAINGSLRAPLFQWHGGDWNASAPGVTTHIASGTTLSLASGGYKDFNRRSITVDAGGTVTWQSGYLRAGNGSVFTNNGTFLDKNVSGYSAYNPGEFGGTFRFVNRGAYTRDVGGTTYFDVPFENHGTVTLSAGDLRLQGGGIMSASSIVNATAGARLYFLDDYALESGAQFAGTGAFIHSAGNLSINGALKAQSFLWNGGMWNATATSAATAIASGTVLTIDGHGYKDFNGRSLTIDAGGTVAWQSGYLRGGNGSVFTNNGTFQDRNASSYSVVSSASSGLGGTFSFVNNGTYLRDVSGVTYFTAPFINHGTLTLASGQIELQGGGTMSATSVVNASSGTRLYFESNYTIADGARFTGAGSLIHAAGTLAVDGRLQAPLFHWSGGDWNATLSGLTTTIAAGSQLVIDSGGYKDFNRRTLAIAPGGTLTWQSGYLRSGNDGAIVNQGTFHDQNGSSYDIDSPAASGFGGNFTFTNAGTYNKTTGGTTRIEIPFTNSGTLNIHAGTLTFASTFANTGTINLAANAIANFPGALTFGTTSPLGGTGTINASAVTAGGLVSPGNSAGKLTLTGTLTLLGTSNLLIELAGNGQGTGYDFLSVGGSATLGGTLQLSLLNGFRPTLPTDNFVVVSAASLTGAFANIANGGYLITSDGGGMFRVNYGAGSSFAANSLVLSDFQAIPEPSTYALLALGAGVVVLTLRRRRS